MDTSTLKTLLASQDQAFRSTLDILIEQIKDDARSTESAINELTISLEFTQKEVEDLKQEVENHKQVKVQYQEIIKKNLIMTFKQVCKW